MKGKKRWLKAQKYEEDYWRSVGSGVISGADWYQKKSRQLVDKLLKFKSQKLENIMVLEIGTGPVGVISFFDQFKCVSVDPLETYFSVKPEILKSRNRNVHYLPGKGENLSFKNHVFDIVVLDNMLDHCENPELVLHEVSRVLRNKGLVYFEINVRTALGERVRKLIELFELDQGHPYSFSKKSISFLLREHFTVLEETCGNVWENIRYYLRKRSLKGILKLVTGTVEFRYYAFLQKIEGMN